DVIINAADCQCLHAVVPSDAAHEGPQSRLEIDGDQLAPFFRAEDAVKEAACVGVWHGAILSRLSFSRPYGTVCRAVALYPAINRWAIISCPYRGSKQQVSIHEAQGDSRCDGPHVVGRLTLT